jgi:GNAT superfamily N-acetyltransferase
MTGADLDAGLRLTRAAGWNQLEADWRFFLNYPCIVAEVDGEVAGTVATLPYGWISMLLVSPSQRHKGIATALLEESLRLLKDVETVYLDATPAGQPLYAKFGFMPHYPLLRLHCGAHTHACNAGTHAGAPRHATPADLPQILALDREIFGADRSPLLRDLLTRAPQFAYISERGFSLGRPGNTADHLGPVVADNPHAAQSLITAALTHNPARPHLLDVTDPQGPTSDWLRSANFAPQRPLLRMYRGPRPHPADPRQFAIAGPEFG